MKRLLIFSLLIITPQLLIAEERSWSLDQVNNLLTVRGSRQNAAGAFGNSQVFSGDSLIELNGNYQSVSGVFTPSPWFSAYDLAGGQQVLHVGPLID